MWRTPRASLKLGREIGVGLHEDALVPDAYAHSNSILGPPEVDGGLTRLDVQPSAHCSGLGLRFIDCHCRRSSLPGKFTENLCPTGADVVYQLHSSILGIQLDLFWLWTWSVQSRECHCGVPSGRRGLYRANDRQRSVASLVPIRTSGLALALPHVRAGTSNVEISSAIQRISVLMRMIARSNPEAH